MKTKKLLSFMLAIVMVVSMAATLGVTVSAASAECADCNHTGKVDCNECYGTGLVNCIECSGSGQCYYCGGTGKHNWCDECDGSNPLCQHCCGDGLSDCVICEGSGICDECDGAKTFACSNCTEGKVNCSACNGTGYVTVPDECYLDLDSTTTDIPEKKDIDQNYNLTVTTLPSASGAVTKVKLSWEIKDINATRTDNKVWDTTELKWVVASSNTTVMDKGTAKFTLENYSSVKVDATAKFEALSDKNATVAFDEATGTDGKITLDTANGSKTYDKTNVPKGEITVTVTPTNDYFKDKTATTTAAKYGTYTVTLSQSVEKKVTVLKKSEGGNTYLYVELTGFDEGEHTYEWSHNWNGAKRDGDMTAIPSGITVEDNGAKLNLGSSPWMYCGNYRVTVDGIPSELTTDSYIGG